MVTENPKSNCPKCQFGVSFHAWDCPHASIGDIRRSCRALLESVDRCRREQKRIKQSVTYWQGKFHMVRQENNKLRKKLEKEWLRVSDQRSLDEEGLEPSEDENWPRVRDLPEHERKPFVEWLTGQTRPLAKGWQKIPQSQWDWYFPWDYQKWKLGQPVTD